MDISLKFITVTHELRPNYKRGDIKRKLYKNILNSTKKNIQYMNCYKRKID